MYTWSTAVPSGTVRRPCALGPFSSSPTSMDTRSWRTWLSICSRVSTIRLSPLEDAKYSRADLKPVVSESGCTGPPTGVSGPRVARHVIHASSAIRNANRNTRRGIVHRFRW